MSKFKKKAKFEHNKLLEFIKSLIQNQKIKRTVLRLNEQIFSHLYVVTNILLLIELATYRGFTFKYLFLSTFLLVGISIISFLFILVTKIGKDKELSKTSEFVLQINSLLLLPIILVNYLLISLDDYYYSNYLYSKFHINPHNFQLILSFNVSIYLLNILTKFKSITIFLSKIISTKSVIHIIFYLAAFSFVIPQAQLVSTWMYQTSFRIVKTINYSWKDKLIYLNGGENGTGWIVTYTDFINKHVDPQGIIFIPPQKESWQMEGNPYYMRWFIYPRDTVQVQDTISQIPETATYVLIDNGAWPGMNEYGWPKIKIPAENIEKIIFIDRQTKEETIVVGEDYNPEAMSYKWGVIKLKK